MSINESMLLLDEALIDDESGVEREVQPGKKSAFVMEPDRDKPWEYCGAGMSKCVCLYGTTLYDDLTGKYRMWYAGRMGPHWRYESSNYQIPGLYVPRTDEKPYNCNGVTQDKYGRTFVDNDRGDLTCYAESDDGINWVKPNLGIFTFDGSPDNNIIWDLHGVSVFIDREEPNPDKRYKAIGFCRRYRNIFLITSPDGIRWDDEIARRKYDALRAEFHNLSGFRYNNLYLGLVGALYVTGEQIPGEKNQMPCNGPIDSQIVYSRDGINWAHADRERTAAIPRGDAGSFDSGMIAGTATQLIIEGDNVHWYYTGCDYTHGEVDLDKKVTRVGRATWQRHRFVALSAQDDGMVTTNAMPFPEDADYLEVNADAEGGQVRAEFCGADGRVLDGFSREECLPLSTDDLRWRVRWNAADISTIHGDVKLRFLLNRSKLYSFTFRKG